MTDYRLRHCDTRLFEMCKIAIRYARGTVKDAARKFVTFRLVLGFDAGGGGGTLGISGWGCAAVTLKPLTYTRASSAEFCYPILE